MTSQRQQLPLDLTPLFDALEKPLALVDDPNRKQQYELLLANSRVHQEKAMVGLVSSLLDGLNEAGGGRASIAIQGDGYVVNVEHETADAEAEPVFDASEEIERVTLRLPKRLKLAIDQVAERSGQSTNTWYVRTLGRALFHQARERGFPFAPGGEQSWGWRGRGRRRGGHAGGPEGGEVD